jgi:uncharacterized protein YndB with AHSA1/START domain
MRAYTFRQHIDRPPQRVWDVLVDLPLAPRWRPLVKQMETTDAQPVHPGSRVRVTIEFFGRVESRESQTVAFEPPRRWVLHSTDKPAIEGFFGFEVEPEGNGSRVTHTLDLKAHSVLTWLFLPLIARGERTRRMELLGNLKRVVEATPT